MRRRRKTPLALSSFTGWGGDGASSCNSCSGEAFKYIYMQSNQIKSSWIITFLNTKCLNRCLTLTTPVGADIPEWEVEQPGVFSACRAWQAALTARWSAWYLGHVNLIRISRTKNLCWWHQYNRQSNKILKNDLWSPPSVRLSLVLDFELNTLLTKWTHLVIDNTLGITAWLWLGSIVDNDYIFIIGPIWHP